MAWAGRGQTVVVTVIEVAIAPGRVPGMFRVQVVAPPAGEASAEAGLDADALLARRGLLQQAVLASAVPGRRVLPETEQPIREVGEVLFAGLLGTGEVAGRYRASAAVAAMRGEGLRVVLRIGTPVLAGLPWEAMYDQAAGAYVCRQDQLVRHIPVASVPAPLRVRPPLRTLGVVSSPRGLPALDVEKEQGQLARALARPASKGLAEVHWAPSATWADLQDLLLEGEWHVLHFIGHGDFDPAQDEGMLALVREDGRADLVAAHRLVDLLRQTAGECHRRGSGREQFHEQALGHVGRNQDEHTVAAVLVTAVGPGDSRAVERFPHRAVQALPDRQLVPVGATPIPEPLNVNDDYGPVNGQPSILHLPSPRENKAEAKLSLI